ncbi:MAG TPA: hypothetical protein VFE27_21290 [Acidobacteriaceae bacterium]|jgi:hypothetical protein|nr:hypothetical protein [Acidobacteriaceae bacterium]
MSTTLMMVGKQISVEASALSGLDNFYVVKLYFEMVGTSFSPYINPAKSSGLQTVCENGKRNSRFLHGTPGQVHFATPDFL